MEAAAAVGSLASVGFKAAGQYEQAKGTAAGDEFKAAELDRAARYGQLQALQTGGQLTRKLAVDLGNIRSQSAAMNQDITSPTRAAMIAGTEKFGHEAVQINMDNIMEQTRQQEADAQYMRSAASSALLSGKLAVGGTLLGAFGPSGSNPQFGIPTG